MKADVKKLWLKALRSGKYRQGRDRLRTKTNGYCCLGVLCDVYRKTTKTGKWVQTDQLWNFEGRSGVLPYKVRRWAGLKQEDPELDPTSFSGNASSVNDLRRSNFKKIANLIERNL